MKYRVNTDEANETKSGFSGIIDGRLRDTPDTYPSFRCSSTRCESPMFACVDVHYKNEEAVAACVLFSFWKQPRPQAEYIRHLHHIAPYEPGKFYKRELPCILSVLELVETRPEVILVDGYVWLSGEGEPGLGAYLYEALERKSTVIGIAKSHYFDGPNVMKIKRGASARALFITAAGMPLKEAGFTIQNMHGSFRIPTLLKRVDEIARNAI